MMAAEQIDFAPRAVPENDLNKKGVAILRNCDRLIEHYYRAGKNVSEIALFKDDYRCLNEQVKGLGNMTYRGYKLVRYGG